MDPSWDQPRNTNSNLFIKGLDPSVDNKALHDTFSSSVVERLQGWLVEVYVLKKGPLVVWGISWGLYYTVKWKLFLKASNKDPY